MPHHRHVIFLFSFSSSGASVVAIDNKIEQAMVSCVCSCLLRNPAASSRAFILTPSPCSMTSCLGSGQRWSNEARVCTFAPAAAGLLLRRHRPDLGLVGTLMWARPTFTRHRAPLPLSPFSMQISSLSPAPPPAPLRPVLLGKRQPPHGSV